MTLQRTTKEVAKQPKRRSLSRSSRSMGVYVLAKRGHGKSRLLGRKIAMEDFLAGIPQAVFDPIGGTIDNFLDSVCRFLAPFPPAMRSATFQRIIYVDMSGKGGFITPFPLYYRLGTERSLLEISERYLQTIIKSNPDLFHAQVLGWPPLHRIGVNSGLVLAALGYQITEAEDLLDNPEVWEASGRFAKAEQVSPEAKRAVSYFRNKYIPMREHDRSRVTTPFLDKIFTFSLDPTFRAMFGASEPGIKWNDVVARKQTILLDFRHEQDEEMRRFKMLWVFDYLYSWIKTRGRQDDKPFGIIIDEFAHMTQQVISGNNPLAKELDEFINVYMRQHTIWFTAAHQELYQLDEQLRNTLLSLGTYIFGGMSSMESARVVSDALFFRNPYRVKDYHRNWARQGYASYVSPLDYFVLDEDKQYLPLEEQREILANQLKQLGLFRFLLRPAMAEGDISSEVQSLSLKNDDRDPETGEYHFPDQALMARLRAVGAAQSGIPVATILKEQEHRLQPVPAVSGVNGHAPQRPQQAGQKRHKDTESSQANPVSRPKRKVVRQHRISKPGTREGKNRTGDPCVHTQKH